MSFYDDASWLLIPSGIEEDIVFAQKPISGLGDLTFTRASDATYTDASGVVRRSPYNLLQQSEAFNVSPWSLSRTSAFGSGSIVNATTAPNGTLTADYIQQASGQTNSGGVFVAMPYITGQSYTLSVYAKKAETRYIRPGFAIGVGGSGIFGYFDLETGVVGTPDAGVTQTIQSVGDGWYRCTISATSQVTTLGNTFIYQSSTNSPTTTPLEGVFIWGAQLVEGTSALDYFPTTNRQDVPRIDFRNADGTLSSCGRLLLEPQRTNSIRNSSMVGAVAGSPGTAPTNWATSNAGLTQTIVGIGNESGLPYIDLRFNGTATSIFFELRLETSTGIAASNAQVWTFASYLKFTSGSIPIGLGMYERTGAGSFITSGQATVSVTSTLQRFAFTRTLSGGATVGAVQPIIISTLTNGAAYDFTIRIAAPQMELGAYATTWVPTTTAAVTRIKDDAQKTGVSSIIGQSAGTIFWDINDLTGTPTSTGNPDFAIRNTAFTNWIGVTTNSFASPFRVVVRPTSGSIIDYTANINRAKAAVAWSSAGAVLYVNGAQVGTSAVNPNFSFDIIQMLGGIISYKTNQAALFPTRLSNAELAQLTTL